ncbi:MAG: hypothetical protein WBD02_01905 [Acidimicrobiia bacterium]
MVRRVHIAALLVVGMLAVGAATPVGADSYDPPPVISTVSVLGPYQSGGAGSVGGTSRVRASLSPIYWKSITSIGSGYPGFAGLSSGVPCDPVTNIWMQHYQVGDPIPPNFTGKSWVAELMNRVTGASEGELRFGCSPTGTPSSEPNQVPSIAEFDFALADVLKASEPSFSPSRRALTGLEFRVWGTGTGDNHTDVPAVVDGWTSTAHVDRLGYRIKIRDVSEPSNVKTLVDETVSSMGDEHNPALRYTFQHTGTVEVTVSTTWNVTSSQLAGNSLGVSVATTVSPMGEILLERTARFQVIQVRSALVNRS